MFGKYFIYCRFFDKLFIFSLDYVSLETLKNQVFLSLNTSFSLQFVKIDSFLKGFNFFGWQLFSLRPKFYRSLISNDNIVTYKLRLKFLIKKISLYNLFLGLELLNKEIYLWTSIYSFSDKVFIFFKNLDFYIYNLLWKFLKKRHPRRPNTWIYTKYWKNLDNSWYFSIYDFKRNQFFVLQKHLALNNFLYKLPYSFDIYNYTTSRRMNNLWFKKINHFQKDIYYILWKSQFGLCFSCHNLFENFEIKAMKFSTKRYFNNCSSVPNYLFNFSLIHVFCS